MCAMSQSDIKDMEKKAKKGDVVAQRLTGIGYLEGYKVDDKKAFKWLSLAAEGGDAEAMYRLGKMYEDGKVKDVNSEMAWSWYVKAANVGNVASQMLLANSLKEQNKMTEAKDWFFRAAIQDNADAQYEYAMFLLSENNESEAKSWFRKAANKGHEQATRQHELILQHKKEVAEAEARRLALEAARRDSIQRVQAEQQRRQDSIDIAIGRKLPPKRMLIDGCNTYTPPRNEFFSYDFERSNYFTLFKALCDNDVLAYYGKDKLDDLDKTVYKNSEQYKSDLAVFQKKKTEKYALAYPFGSNAEWKFFADGFSFESWKHTTTDFASNIRPNYMGFMSLLIPVLSSQTKLNDLQQYFKCTDLEKLQQVRSMKSDLELLYIFKPGMTVTTIINTYSTHYAYFTNPIGLYLVNRNTGETILDLSYCLRKTGFSNDKQRIEAAAKADYKKRQQAQERNKPKYHSTAKPVQCSVCLGRGVTVGSPEKINGVWVSEKRCYFCNGRGYTMEHYY